MIDIKTLMFDKSLSQRQMAEIIETTQSEVSNFATGRRRLLRKHIDNLIAFFGEETINSYTKPDTPIVGMQSDATVTLLSRETVEEVRKDIEEEIMEVESFPVLPEEVATKPGVDIREYIEESGSELERINPSRMLQHADMAERILRTSMLPTFQPDDIVFVRFLQDKMKIVDGDTYYIDSKNRPTMIRQIKFEENNKLRLIAKNEQYGDIVMDRGDINNVAIIVGLLRMNFSDQYTELEALRRKRDNQLDRVLEVVEQQSVQQGKLIDFITKNN